MRETDRGKSETDRQTDRQTGSEVYSHLSHFSYQATTKLVDVLTMSLYKQVK